MGLCKVIRWRRAPAAMADQLAAEPEMEVLIEVTAFDP